MKLGAIAESKLLSSAGEPGVALLQSTSRGAVAVHVLMMLPVAALSLLPFGLVIAEAAGRPEVTNLLLGRPLSAMLLLAGLAASAGLLASAAAKTMERLGRRQVVTISNGRVTVMENRPWGSRSWQEALSAYEGVAHHIRASLSGSRHEMVLVHPDKRRSILLDFGPAVREADLAAMADRLGMPVVPAKALYRAASIPTAFRTPLSTQRASVG